MRSFFICRLESSLRALSVGTTVKYAEGWGTLKTLDETYAELNGIYLDANFYKSEFQVFAHLTEVIGGLSSIASGKKDELPQAEVFMPKVMAWWLALAGKVGVRSVQELLWVKYPDVCPYCTQSPHDESKCKTSLDGPNSPQWSLLSEKGKHGTQPRTLTEWQSMFARIYPVSSTESMQVVFARLTEELGELAEAVRVREVAPAYFISEAADVFAWLMRVQTWYNLRKQAPASTLEDWIAAAYPGYCLECRQGTCACPAILDSSFGRLAHEVPESVVPASLMPIQESLARFRARKIQFGDKTYELQSDDLTTLRSGVDELLRHAYDDHERWSFANKALMDTLYQLRNLNSATSVNEGLIRQLSVQIQKLDPSTRERIEALVADFGTGLFTWVFTMALTGGTGMIVPQ